MSLHVTHLATEDATPCFRVYIVNLSVAYTDCLVYAYDSVSSAACRFAACIIWLFLDSAGGNSHPLATNFCAAVHTLWMLGRWCASVSFEMSYQAR